MRSWEYVAELADAVGASSYAHIVVPITSMEHVERMDRARFDAVEGFVYTVPELAPYADVRSLPSIDELEAILRGDPRRFDIVFVDPWHTYEHTERILRLGLGLVTIGGWLVMHDCWPRDERLLGAYPGSVQPWSGDTWRAFVEIAPRLRQPWCIVDDDFGLGIVGPNPHERPVFDRSWMPPVPAGPSSGSHWMRSHDHAPWLIPAHGWRRWLSRCRR